MDKLKRIGIAISLGIAIIGGVWLASPSKAAKCSDFNVVACGTHSQGDLKVAYARPHVKSLYNHSGITDSMINNGTNMKQGTVDANGNVIVDGQVVATGARTYQAKAGTRQVSPEKTVNYGGYNYYQYTTGQSFIDGTTTYAIYAWFDNYGKFIAGVIKDCGNPVWGQATWKAKDVKVCDLTSKKIVTIKENEYDSKKHSKDLEDCKETKVCDLDSNTIITIKEKQFDSKKHSKDLTDCQKTRVCELKTGKIITIKEKEYDEKKHSRNEDDCDKAEVCRISDKQTVTVTRKELNNSQYTTDMSKCKENPVTPPTPETPTPGELPKTGTANIVMSALGLGGLTTAIIAYVASRRQM